MVRVNDEGKDSKEMMSPKCDTIPGSNDLSNPAKWIKLTEDGQVAGYSEVQGPSDMPTFSEMYLSPSYHSTDPYQPMPCWFCHMLTGDPAHYYTLREAVGKLDDLAHLTKVSHYRKLEDDIVTAKPKSTPSGQTLRAGLRPRSSVMDALLGLVPMVLLPILKDSKHATSG